MNFIPHLFWPRFYMDSPQRMLSLLGTMLHTYLRMEGQTIAYLLHSFKHFTIHRLAALAVNLVPTTLWRW